jgi:hypothetical protein
VGPARFRRVQTNLNYFKYDSNNFKSVQTSFDPSRTSPNSKKIEIKYGCDCFGERNSFLHRNFFSFEMDFELKV